MSDRAWRGPGVSGRCARLLVCAAVFVCMLLMISAAAEETVWFDCTENFSGYARIVAQLNAGGDTKAAAVEDELYAVLCRTTGGSPESVSPEPAYAAAGPDGRFTLFYRTAEQAQAAADSLSGAAGIVYAECDSEVCSSATAQEEAYLDAESKYSFRSWGADEMRFGVYLAYQTRWASGSTTVAVVDSGVAKHPMLNKRISTSGYDYVDADTDSRSDLFGHGTHVAGIVVDCTEGAAVYLYPIRVLNAFGVGKMSNVVNGVLEACRAGVDVINLSIESSILSTALDDAVKTAINAGITVVIAAGNSGKDTSKVCPAHMTNEGAIVVGAAANNGSTYQRASYSNYGASVDLYAFGTSISSCSVTGGYVKKTGTSMAAPHISAASALIKLMNPSVSPAGIERLLKAASEGEINVPDLYQLVPMNPGLELSALSLHAGDRVSLPQTSWPAASQTKISYSSSAPSVADVVSGELTALSEGTAVITASARNMSSMSFTVKVSGAENCTVLALPPGLRQLDAEAFLNDSQIGHVIFPDGMTAVGSSALAGCGEAVTVKVPDSVTEIGSGALSGVVLCSDGSTAHRYARRYGLDYILTEE